MPLSFLMTFFLEMQAILIILNFEGDWEGFRIKIGAALGVGEAVSSLGVGEAVGVGADFVCFAGERPQS